MRVLLVGVLRAYQKLVSPMFGQSCRFYPSCSSYAIEAISEFGAVRGSIMALRRLIRCHPWSAGGVDHVPSTASRNRG